MHAAPKRTCSHPGCVKPVVATCRQPLSGNLEGQWCLRPLCADHKVDVNGSTLCQPHVRLRLAPDSGLYVSPTSGQLVPAKAGWR